jgi:VanZ family protein
MLEKTPTELEWLSWVYAGLAALLIFITVPFARAAQVLVTNSVGREFFLYIVAFAAIAGAYAAFNNLRKRKLGLGAYIWLFGVGAIYAIYSYHLRKNPEEAIHFVEYGALSLLVYRALVHRVHDYSVYITAALVVGGVGVIDECIQWLTPARFGDLRDIQINFVAGGLMQVAIAAGLRPSIVAQSPSPPSLRILFLTAALGFFLFGLSLAITPDTTARLTSYVPSLSYLLNKRGVAIVDYGHLYRDPQVGNFRSRFTKDQLVEYDRIRGAGAAKVMDQFISEDNYKVFQRKYNVIHDPYIHEAGVHLFRRNRYLSRAMSGVANQADLYHVALHENRILELYFPTALRQSKHEWNEELRIQVEENASKKKGYESPVSRNLITRFSKRQILLGFAAWLVVLFLLATYFGRRPGSSQQP